MWGGGSARGGSRVCALTQILRAVWGGRGCEGSEPLNTGIGCSTGAGLQVVQGEWCREGKQTRARAPRWTNHPSSTHSNSPPWPCASSTRATPPRATSRHTLDHAGLAHLTASSVTANPCARSHCSEPNWEGRRYRGSAGPPIVELLLLLGRSSW